MDKFKCTNCYYSFYEAEDSAKNLIVDKDNRVTDVDGLTMHSNWEVGCGLCGGGILYKVEG